MFRSSCGLTLCPVWGRLIIDTSRHRRQVESSVLETGFGQSDVIEMYVVLRGTLTRSDGRSLKTTHTAMAMAVSSVEAALLNTVMTECAMEMEALLHCFPEKILNSV